MNDDSARLKQMVAERAAALVEDGMRLGLGSGSTAEAFVRALHPRLHAGLRIEAVASSGRTERLAREVGLPLIDLAGPLDFAVDGADAIERGSLHAIKGLGGALTREKLVAAVAQQFVLIADGSKLVGTLQDVTERVPIPVEVLSFGWQTTRARLSALGRPVLRERDGSAFTTDNGNFILDLHVERLDDATAFGQMLKEITGVVEHGLFTGLATQAIIAATDGIIELRPGGFQGSLPIERV
jgi:ribose 5-phosphate isomerase A